jgi:hypothetical protein
MIFDLVLFSDLSHICVIVGGWGKVLAQMSTALPFSLPVPRGGMNDLHHQQS